VLRAHRRTHEHPLQSSTALKSYAHHGQPQRPRPRRPGPSSARPRTTRSGAQRVFVAVRADESSIVLCGLRLTCLAFYLSNSAFAAECEGRGRRPRDVHCASLSWASVRASSAARPDRGLIPCRNPGVSWRPLFLFFFALAIGACRAGRHVTASSALKRPGSDAFPPGLRPPTADLLLPASIADGLARRMARATGAKLTFGWSSVAVLVSRQLGRAGAMVSSTSLIVLRRHAAAGRLARARDSVPGMAPVARLLAGRRRLSAAARRRSRAAPSDFAAMLVGRDQIGAFMRYLTRTRRPAHQSCCCAPRWRTCFASFTALASPACEPARQERDDHLRATARVILKMAWKK